MNTSGSAVSVRFDEDSMWLAIERRENFGRAAGLVPTFVAR